MPLVSGASFGSYVVLEPLGAGGMGEVYRARDPRLERDVALKILPEHCRLDPQRLARFRREAQTLASLGHPNIAALHGIEEVDGIEALVLELIEGPTLGDRIARGPVGLDEALSIACQIADALECAHEHGIVHRDLKPDNIKVRPDRTVKVLDFGLAKPTDAFGAGADTRASTLTDPTLALTGILLGTAGYMSPEQARGIAVDRRADIWAFGCVLYEMLSGRRAFSGERVADVIAQILEREPDFGALPADTPPVVRRLLRRCLEKDPKRRLRDIADARRDCEDAHGAPEAGADARRPPPGRATVRALTLAAGVVVIVLGIVVVARMWRSPIDGAPREFVLLPPDGAVFGGNAIDRTPAFALSPDGRRLAFVATAASGPSLWIRWLDSVEAVPVAGTEGAAVFSPPSWSPDGEFLAFFADGKLKKVSVRGGAPVALADAPLGSGLTWSRDGGIVFAPSTQSGLFRIPDGTGRPVAVTQLGSSDLGHVFPQFLPDGRRFLYLIRAAAPRKGIYVSSIDSPVERRIRAAREKALYAPPGFLLFLDNGGLFAQPFNLDRLELSGDPVPVAESVAFIATDGRASFDVSATGTLVYRPSGVLATSQPIWKDRSGKTLETTGAPGDYQTASLSPDGSRLAVELHDLRTGTGDIWIIDLVRGGSPFRFTFDGMHNTRAVWSPDDERLVFTGRPDGGRNLHLKAVGAQLDESLLVLGPDRIPTDWSRNGHILFEEGPAAQRDLWTLQMPHGTPHPFLQTEFDEQDGQFSPNGRWVAYTSNENGPNEVYVRSFPDGTGKTKVSGAGGHAPRWNRTGTEIYYVRPDSSVMAVPVESGDRFTALVPQRLFTTDMRINERGALTAAGWFATDGKRFLIVPNPPARAPAPPITVLLDWTAVLESGAPAARR